MYNLIACVNKHGLLGQENDLYATSSKDLHYFSQVTKGHSLPKPNIVVMGYNTWLSLPHKPLKDRYNIVITKKHKDQLEDTCRFDSLEKTLYSTCLSYGMACLPKIVSSQSPPSNKCSSQSKSILIPLNS